MTTRIHPAKERMLSQNAFKRLHRAFLSGYAGDSVHWAARLGPASICYEGGHRRGGLRDRLGVPQRSGGCAVPIQTPHTQRWQRLARATTIGTVRVECRHDVQPRTALTQEVVATRTT